jgi:DNA replication protein DnaC
MNEKIESYLQQEQIKRQQLLDDINLIDLTDEEYQLIIFEAKKQKYYRLKSEQYLQQLKQDEWQGYTQPRLAELYLKRLAQRVKQNKRNDIKDIFTDLAGYHLNGSTTLDTSKGILLIGNIGTGKTIIASCVLNNPIGKFEMVNCNKLAAQFDGRYDEIDYYTKENYCGGFLCFDDLGDEREINHYGNRINLMSELLKERYVNVPHNRTMVTTNLTPDQMKEKYGERVYSRMREMFNIIPIAGSDLRQ